MKKVLIIIFGLLFLSPILIAGEIDSASHLRGLARSQWSAVELQGKGLVRTELTKEQVSNQVRQAVVWLEAADRLEDNNKYVLADLEYLYRSEMIDDSGRGMAALVR